MPPITRRRALGALAGLTAGATVLLAEWRAGWVSDLAARLAPRPDSSSPVGRLNGHELDNVIAFGADIRR